MINHYLCVCVCHIVILSPSFNADSANFLCASEAYSLTLSISAEYLINVLTISSQRSLISMQVLLATNA